MNILIRPYTAEDAGAWDLFCEGSLQATFLHTRRFISYHGDRFDDRSLLIEDEAGNLLGVLPAASTLGDHKNVVTHPGVTYGGLIHQGKLRGEQMVNVLKKIGQHYFELGYASFMYKATPHFYHKSPSHDDIYALFRLGAKKVRCDISSTIDLQNRRPVSERRSRGFKKAIKNGVKIVKGSHYLPEFWSVLADNLASKHQAKSVHSLEEINLLIERFPNNINCIFALIDEVVVAGVVLFITPAVFHAQYIASSEVGYDCSALDAVFDCAITMATSAGKRWFDFGINTENAGMTLNEGLYQFKTEFGSGSTVYDFYELNLLGHSHGAI